MNSRDRLLGTLSFSANVTPPLYEREFSEEVLKAWKAEGKLGGASPEEYFSLDHHEDLPIQWRRPWDEKIALENETDLESIRRTYDPDRPGKIPEDWEERTIAWRHREFALAASPWGEGFLQVIGIADWESFTRAMLLLHDRPGLVDAVMEHYARYIEELIDRTMPHVQVDYAVFYEPIASNHAPVVSPDAYARFAVPALRRVVERLDRYGVMYRFMWTAGEIRPLIPSWLGAGINGLVVRQVGSTGTSYADLRRDFDPRLRFFGGVDWKTIAEGPKGIDRELERNVRPLLEQGGYIPHLDDTVRLEIPFEHYSYYRRKLNALVSEIHSQE